MKQHLLSCLLNRLSTKICQSATVYPTRFAISFTMSIRQSAICYHMRMVNQRGISIAA